VTPEAPPENELLWADFWALIDSGVEDGTVVVRRIEAMTEQELVNFYWRYQDAVDDLVPDYDDMREDIGGWLVTQGKAAYDAVLADADLFPARVPHGARRSYQGDVIEVYFDRYPDDPIRDQDYPPATYPEIEPDAFWDLIDSGRKDPTVVERRIEAMSEQELVDFYWRYEDAVAELLGAEYGQNFLYDGAASEDFQQDVAEWIVSRGRRFYEVHLDPKRFPLELDEAVLPYNHVAANEYHRRCGDVVRSPEDPPPAPPRRKGLRARLFGHGDS
jgi:hypothetical protein